MPLNQRHCLFGNSVMKREQVREQHAGGHISATHVIQNPADTGEMKSNPSPAWTT
eukprot:gene7523-8802_t